MLLHLYSAHAGGSAGKGKLPVKAGDEERPRTNGHARVPNAADRQAHDAQEFELEGLMSDDEEDGGKNRKLGNGVAH